MKDEKLPITEHLEELRTRLIRSLVAITITSIVAYFFAEKIINLLLSPLIKSIPEGSNLVFITLTEAFIAYLKVSLMAGLIVSSPYVFYQLWLFITPGLYEKERKASISFVTMAVAGLLAGISFCYFIILPVIFPFLLSFGKDLITPLPTIKSSISVALRLLIIFGLIFEIPVVSFYLARLGLLKGDFLKGARKIIFVLSFVIGAIITPPDVISQLIVGFPLYLIFEISIFVAMIGEKKRASTIRPEAEERDESS